MPKLAIQVLLTENDVAFMLYMFKKWEDSPDDPPFPHTMTEAYDMKAKLDAALTEFHGNKRGGM